MQLTHTAPARHPPAADSWELYLVAERIRRVLEDAEYLRTATARAVAALRDTIAVTRALRNQPAGTPAPRR